MYYNQIGIVTGLVGVVVGVGVGVGVAWIWRTELLAAFQRHISPYALKMTPPSSIQIQILVAIVCLYSAKYVYDNWSSIVAFISRLRRGNGGGNDVFLPAML